MLAHCSAVTQRLLRAACAVLALAMLAGCADGPEAPIDEPVDPSIVETQAATTTTSLVVVGEPTSRFSLGTGDCFNRYRTDDADFITIVSCDLAHDGEVFDLVSHPAPVGEPWPGDAALSKYAQRLCYDRFEDYVGIIYELSVLGIGTFTPPQSNWEDPAGRYRGITCYLVNTSGNPVVGSMRQKGV